MSIITEIPFVGTVLDWILDHENKFELPLPRPQAGDRLISGDLEIEILAIEACPYVVPPAKWDDYSADGDWAYVYEAATGRVEWVPVAFLAKCLLEGEAS
jgi:hypothetical protein